MLYIFKEKKARLRFSAEKRNYKAGPNGNSETKRIKYLKLRTQ